MSTELVLSIIAVLVAIAAGLRGARWMSETADLRISLFRPYRADAWPHGVQEEDAVPWRWDVIGTSADSAGADGDGPSDAEERPRVVDDGCAPVGRLEPVRAGQRRGR